MPSTEIMAMCQEAARYSKLTDKELALIKQLCLPYKIIAQNTGVNAVVLRKRVTRLVARFEVENRAAMVVKALKLGLVTIDELTYREYGNGKNAPRKSN